MIKTGLFKPFLGRHGVSGKWSIRNVSLMYAPVGKLILLIATFKAHFTVFIA